jgi:hypothetical protein
MSDEHNQTKQLKMDAWLSPSLKSATRAWNVARHRYQIEPIREHLNGYDAATNVLGQAISLWRAEQPELVEQFRFWFAAHPGD